MEKDLFNIENLLEQEEKIKKNKQQHLNEEDITIIENKPMFQDDSSQKNYTEIMEKIELSRDVVLNNIEENNSFDKVSFEENMFYRIDEKINELSKKVAVLEHVNNINKKEITDEQILKITEHIDLINNNLNNRIDNIEKKINNNDITQEHVINNMVQEIILGEQNLKKEKTLKNKKTKVKPVLLIIGIVIMLLIIISIIFLEGNIHLI